MLTVHQRPRRHLGFSKQKEEGEGFFGGFVFLRWEDTATSTVHQIYGTTKKWSELGGSKSLDMWPAVISVQIMAGICTVHRGRRFQHWFRSTSIILTYHMLVNDWDQRRYIRHIPQLSPIHNKLNTIESWFHWSRLPIYLDETLSRMWKKLPPCNSSLSPLSKKSVPWTRNPCAVSYDDVFRRNGWDLFGAELWWI